MAPTSFASTPRRAGDRSWSRPARSSPPARESRFLELAAENGVLFKRGAYNFPALAHDDDAIRDIEAGASSALVALRDEEDSQ